MKFAENIYGKWNLIRPLSEHTFLVSTPDLEQKVLKIVSFPQSQSNVFDLMTKGIDFSDADQLYSDTAHDFSSLLERLQYLHEDSGVLIPQEHVIRKSPGQTGWQVLLFKDPAVNLRDFLAGLPVPLDPEQKKVIVRDILKGLRSGLQAGVCHGHLCPENILILPDGSVAVDDVAQNVFAEKTGNARKDEFSAPEEQMDEKSDVYSAARLIEWIFDAGVPEDWKPVLEQCLGARENRPASVFELDEKLT